MTRYIAVYSRVDGFLELGPLCQLKCLRVQGSLLLEQQTLTPYVLLEAVVLVFKRQKT